LKRVNNHLKNIKKKGLGEKPHLKKKKTGLIRVRPGRPGLAGFFYWPVFYLTRTSSATRSTRLADPGLITRVKGEGEVCGRSPCLCVVSSAGYLDVVIAYDNFTSS